MCVYVFVSTGFEACMLAYEFIFFACFCLIALVDRSVELLSASCVCIFFIWFCGDVVFIRVVYVVVELKSGQLFRTSFA